MESGSDKVGLEEEQASLHVTDVWRCGKDSFTGNERMTVGYEVH